jgi:hypothetical protein
MIDKICYAILAVFGLLGVGFGFFTAFILKDGYWGHSLAEVILAGFLLVNGVLGLRKS